MLKPAGASGKYPISLHYHLAVLLLRFPELREPRGAVSLRLEAEGGPELLSAWCELLAQEIRAEDDDAY